jgi:hypothetical protein
VGRAASVLQDDVEIIRCFHEALVLDDVRVLRTNTQHGESSINIKIERSHTLRFFNKSISDCKLEDLEWGNAR